MGKTRNYKALNTVTFDYVQRKKKTIKLTDLKEEDREYIELYMKWAFEGLTNEEIRKLPCNSIKKIVETLCGEEMTGADIVDWT